MAFEGAGVLAASGGAGEEPIAADGRPPRLSLGHLSRPKEPPVLRLPDGLDASDFIGFKEWMEQNLYDHTEGYYASGVMGFHEGDAATATPAAAASAESGKSDGAGVADFSTFASRRDSILHLALLDMAYRLYKERAPSEMGKPFIFVELSGGNGLLAEQFLQTLEYLAETQGGIWAGLYADMQYTIYEISPALAARQAERNARFIESKHLKIENRDACTVSERRPDFVFSNELLDVMPAHKLFFRDDDTWLVECVVPFVDDESPEGIESKPEFLAYVADYFTASGTPLRGTPLDRTALEAFKASADFDPKQIAWCTVHLPLSACPEVETEVGGLLRVKTYELSSTDVLTVD